MAGFDIGQLSQSAAKEAGLSLLSLVSCVRGRGGGGGRDSGAFYYGEGWWANRFLEPGAGAVARSSRCPAARRWQM